MKAPKVSIGKVSPNWSAKGMKKATEVATGVNVKGMRVAKPAKKISMEDIGL